MARLPAIFYSQNCPAIPPLSFCAPLSLSFRSSSLSPSSSLHPLIPCRIYNGRLRTFRIKIAAGSGSVAPTLPELSGALKEIYESCSTWRWKGYSVNFLVRGTGPPLLLVHGFGASIAHWRRSGDEKIPTLGVNIGVLSENYTVYAIDLLGFGSSDKPLGFSYTMEVWSQLILDFLCEIIKKPTVLIGNSVGSLACVIAASEATQGMIRGIVLLNCAGGMNNKAIVDDWRIRLILPLLWLVDFLLKQRTIASAIFENVKKRYSSAPPTLQFLATSNCLMVLSYDRENLKNILLSVYVNKESVDEELIEIIKKPAEDVGALDAFISIVTGPPGPNPVSLMPKVTVPVLLLWGDRDPFTPIDGPVGKYFCSLPSQLSNVSLCLLEGVGHCPHDDRPDLVHENLLPWLAALPAI